MNLNIFIINETLEKENYKFPGSLGVTASLILPFQWQHSWDSCGEWWQRKSRHAEKDILKVFPE
jgi:hypothetical protein